MTTIVGIKTNVGEEAVVVAADTQLNIPSEGDKPSAKKVITKIFHGENWIMADEGRDDDDVRAFYSYLNGKRSLESFLKVCYPKSDMSKVFNPMLFLSPDVIERSRQLINGNGGKRTALERRLLDKGRKKDKSPLHAHFAGMMHAMAYYAKDPVTRAVMQDYFVEVNELNRSHVERTEDMTGTNDFVLGAITPDPDNKTETRVQLLYVDEYGSVKTVNKDKSIEYVATGSGHEHVEAYIDEHKFNEPGKQKLEDIEFGEIDPGNISISNAVSIALRAIIEANVDANSGGFDFAVLRRSGVKHQFKQIQRKVSNALYGIVNDYVRSYDIMDIVPNLPKEE